MSSYFVKAVIDYFFKFVYIYKAGLINCTDSDSRTNVIGWS